MGPGAGWQQPIDVHATKEEESKSQKQTNPNLIDIKSVILFHRMRKDLNTAHDMKHDMSKQQCADHASAIRAGEDRMNPCKEFPYENQCICSAESNQILSLKAQNTLLTVKGD